MDQQLKEVFEMKECNKVLYYEYLLEKLSKKPRIAGYRYHLKLIKKLKKLRVWGILQSKFASCFIGKISVTFKVDRRTLEYWIKKLSENQAWLPDHHKNPAFSRVFTIDQFKTVLALVKITCSQSVIPVTNDQVRIVIQRYYNAQSFHPQPGLHFNASIKFILNLKKILRYSSLRFHPKRRPKHMISTIIDFIIRSRSIFQKKVERNRILNCDESFWRQIEYFSRTWAPTGSDNVSIMTKTDPKSGFTFLATICADGSLLPLVLIASGKTTRVEDNWFGHGRHINEKSNKEEALPNPYYKFSISKRSKTETIIPKSKTDHSEKGWTTNSTFKEYLKFIRSLYPFKEEDKNSRTNRIYLFADTYGAHISEKSINYALDNNVCIVPIPEGCTDIFQPLDLKIFAPMKTKSKKYLEQLISDEIIKNFDFETMNVKKEFTVPAEIDKKTSTALLDIIWYETQRSTVEESWEQAIVQYFTLFNCYNDYDEDKDFEKRLLLREEQRKQEQVRRKYDEKIKNLEKQCSLLICENVKKFFSKKLHECKAQLNSILQPFIKSNKGRKPKKETSNSKNNVTKTVSKKQNNNVIQSSITNQTTDVNSPQEMLPRRTFLIPTFNSSTLSDTQARLQRQSPNTNQTTDVNSPQEMLLRRAFLIPTFNSSTLSDTQARLQRQSPNTNQATDVNSPQEMLPRRAFLIPAFNSSTLSDTQARLQRQSPNTNQTTDVNSPQEMLPRRAFLIPTFNSSTLSDTQARLQRQSPNTNQTTDVNSPQEMLPRRAFLIPTFNSSTLSDTQARLQRQSPNTNQATDVNSPQEMLPRRAFLIPAFNSSTLSDTQARLQRQSPNTNQTTDVNSPQEMLPRRAFLIPTFNSSTLSDTQARLQRQSPNTNQATDRSNFGDDNDFDLLNLPLFSNHKNDKKKKTEPFTIRDYNSYITENQIINHKKQLKLIEPMIINELQKENTQYTSIIERTKELRKQQREQLTNQQLELDKTVREIDQLEHVILSLPKKKEEKTTKAQSKTKRKPKKASSISIIKDPNSLNINSNLPNISSNESSVQIPLNTSLTNTSAVYYNCASQVNNPNI